MSLLANMSWSHPTIAENIVTMLIYIALTFALELAMAWVIMGMRENLEKQPLTKIEVYLIVIMGNILSGVIGFFFLLRQIMGF